MSQTENFVVLDHGFGQPDADLQKQNDEATAAAAKDCSAGSEDEGPKSGAWMRYKVEYRQNYSNELMYQKILLSEEFNAHVQGEDHKSAGGTPAFELVAQYRTRMDPSKMEQSTSREKMDAPPPTLSRPSYSLRIYSLAIINALQSIVQYYPNQDLSGDTIVVPWPYPVLVHHYDELAKRRDECKGKDPATCCLRERDAYEHLKLLLEFLDTNIMASVRAEQERNKRGVGTFEGYWVALKPGNTVLTLPRESNDWTVGVVHSLEGGIFSNPPTPWTLTRWTMEYDGKWIGRVTDEFVTHMFDGEDDNDDLKVFESDKIETIKEDEVAAKIIKHGEMYWNLLHKQCRYHKGNSTEFPYNAIEGLVMIDMQGFYSTYKKPILMIDDDMRKWVSDCTCSVCEKPNNTHKRKLRPLFGNYNWITLESSTELKPHQYLLLPSAIEAFVFATRTWEKVHVANCVEPQFDRHMIDVLVMDETRVRTLKALAKSFARIDKNEEPIGREAWAADFVKGKGNGLIFLLHGRPGVGKTCTAECIAEFTRRPLMLLTSSDIGTHPEEVEMNLTKNFKTAKRWGAVLLIDEADVFMERRTTADLTRNSLVAGFLRALEFYDGILFLTTNRVGTFDDAFISRVHVQLYYPDFTDDQRQQVWKTFVDKLMRERGDCMRLTIDAKEYLRSERMKAVKWNGREIRNAFQTAVSLAEYDAEKDEEGKIVLTDNHLRAVVELSKDFKDYLNSLHKGDEGKRAARKYERLDSYSKDSELN